MPFKQRTDSETVSNRCQCVVLSTVLALLIALTWIPASSARSTNAIVGTFAPMLEAVIQAVVAIRVTGEAYAPIELKPRATRDAASTPSKVEKLPTKNGGSGVIVDARAGYILTNNHVVENATKIEISLYDGRRMLAKLIGKDAGTDLAVLQVDARLLPSIEIGDSDIVRVGDVVVAIGNPFGLEGSASAGIVSAVMRTDLGFGEFEDFFQVDAHIYPGNSGGALVNVHGQLVGINSAIGGRKGQLGGIGFAIPINMAKVIQSERIMHGSMRRGSPGLMVEDLPVDWVGGDASNVTRGAMVKQVLPNSPAAAAGIGPGDVVFGMGKKPVRSAAEYLTRTSIIPLGTTLSFSIYSNGNERVLPLTVSSLVLEPVGQRLQRPMGKIAGALIGDILLGNPHYGNLSGVQILDVPARSSAYQTGFETGDVITSVDGLGVRTSNELAYRNNAAGLQYRVDLVRNGIPGWVRVSR